MSDIASITVTGRLGKDPEIKYLDTSSNSVTSFSVAVGRWEKGGEVTDWYAVKMWGKVGERAANWLKKGDKVAISGSLEIQIWKDRTSGIDRVKPTIVGKEFFNMSPRNTAATEAPATVQDKDLDDIPF